jgi:hypothetical protein
MAVAVIALAAGSKHIVEDGARTAERQIAEAQALPAQET